VDIIPAIQSAISIVQKLRELNQKVGDADMKMLLADLSNELADAKLEAARLKTMLADLEEENGQLKHLKGSGDLASPNYDGTVYRVEGDQSAFCPGCYDTKKAMVRLTKQEGHWKAFGEWECPSCKNTYGKSDV
jgi:hypothetical protein